jgi:hypothetical protein
VFSFQGNPACSEMSDYKKTMLAIMKSLTSLDGKPVAHFEHENAEKWMRGGLYEYSQMKQENMKHNNHWKTMAYFQDFQDKHVNTISEMKQTSSNAEKEYTKQIDFRLKVADMYQKKLEKMELRKKLH